MGWDDRRNVDALKGKTLESITGVEDDNLFFACTDGSSFRMFHSQDCCEYVYIADVVGDMADLIGSPLLVAEEVSSDGVPPVDESDDTCGTYAWTFYKFATIKGSVTLRWYGTSNGYYGVGVDFEEETRKGASRHGRWA